MALLFSCGWTKYSWFFLSTGFADDVYLMVPWGPVDCADHFICGFIEGVKCRLVNHEFNFD